MNILLIAPYYAPSSEVPSVRMISLSNFLIKQGHSVSVVCYSKDKLITWYSEKELSSEVPKNVECINFNLKISRIWSLIPYLSDIIEGKKFRKKLPYLVDLKKFDTVLITCGPYFTLDAIPMIKKKYGIPCVLDFRDLGAINYRPQLKSEKTKTSFWKRPIKFLFKYLIKWREYRAVCAADEIICISDIDKEKMRLSYKISEEKLYVATNGFDEERLEKIHPLPKNKEITAAVFGKFMYYSKERATAVLMAIDSLRKKGYSIKLLHIGRKYSWIDEVMNNNNISEKSFDSKGLMEYSKGMALLGSADFFIVEDTSPDDVGTKIYDYIFWNKPVVAAVPKNIPLALLVNTFEHGYVCDSKEEILNAIKDVVDNKYEKLDSKIDTMKYSRFFQNQIIESVLKKAVESGRRNF